MKFKINSTHFTKGLSRVNNIVSSRVSMPILAHVLLTAESGGISLTTTNLDVGIKLRIKADVIVPGTIALPVKKLSEMVAQLKVKNAEINVELVGQNRVALIGGGAKFNIAGLPSEEFPALPTFANQYEYTLAQTDLTRLLKKVGYAQSTDENRYVLNGVYFSFDEGKLTLVATDGRRLAKVEKEIETKEGEKSTLILPGKTVAEVSRMLGASGNVKIAFNERQVSFVATTDEAAEGLVDSIQLVSKVVEGAYPNYKQVIPKETVNLLTVNREDLKASVSLVKIVTDEKNSSVRLSISNDTISINAHSDSGDAEETVAAKYTGNDVTIAFKPQYLIDPLENIDEDEITFEFKDEISPGVFKTSVDEFLCVVMPQRLN